MKETDAQDELAFIKKIMQDSRRVIAFDGKEFIVWGILVTIGMAVMYVNIAFKYYIHFTIIWGILIGIGWIYSIFRWLIHYRKKTPKTFAAKVLSSVWISFGVTMTLIGFALPPLNVIAGWAIMPLVALGSGMAYFITSVVITEKWVRYSAYGWWVGGLVIAAFPGLHMFLLFAGMMICFQITPGIILQKQYKKELEQSNA